MEVKPNSRGLHIDHDGRTLCFIHSYVRSVTATQPRKGDGKRMWTSTWLHHCFQDNRLGRQHRSSDTGQHGSRSEHSEIEILRLQGALVLNSPQTKSNRGREDRHLIATSRHVHEAIVTWHLWMFEKTIDGLVIMTPIDASLSSEVSISHSHHSTIALELHAEYNL